MKISFISLLIAIILVSALILCSCAQSTSSSTTSSTATTSSNLTPKKGGILRYTDMVGPRSAIGWMADPFSYLGGEWTPIILETLLSGDLKGQLTPFLATNYEVASDQKSITLMLRKGVKFHDGSDLNAAVVKWNLEQLMNAKLGDNANYSSVDTLDDYTVRINLKKYTNTMLGTLAQTYIISKDAYDKNGGSKGGAEYLQWHPVGTGPFKFVSYEPKVSLICTRFDNYWQKGKPYLDGIEMYFIGDAMTRSASFEAGETDCIGGDLSKVEYDLQQKGYKIALMYMSLRAILPDTNNTGSIFRDIKLRQAIDYAIDRDAMVKSLSYGFWSSTHQFAFPGTASYITNLSERKYDPEQAKKLLASAGYGEKRLSIKILASETTFNKDSLVAIQGYLSKVGIDVTLDMLDTAGYENYSGKGWNNALIATGIALEANMNGIIERNLSQNRTRFVSLQITDELQALFTKAANAVTYDPASVQEVTRYIHDNAVLIPVYGTARGNVIKPYVHDAGFYTQQSWTMWTPADAWLSK
jgi:peptide/nickel transport system substrate-binding protein